jgi:biotin transporter BioY
MNVEKDARLKKDFRRISLFVSPVTGIIAAIIAGVYRTDMRNQVAFLFLIFCLVTLIAVLVIRAIGWVVRRSVVGVTEKKENATNEKDRE